MSAAGSVDLTVEKNVGWVVLNNPAKRNAISRPMWQALLEVSEHLSGREGLRAVVIRGQGETFSSGADISEFLEHRRTPDEISEYTRLCQAATGAIEKIPVPVIALIRGYCIGAGSAIALSCDMRYADKSVRFAIPAARLGLGYELPWIKALVNIVGASLAAEVLFTAREVSSCDLVRSGFASKVMPADELDKFVSEVIRSIAYNAPLTVRAAKAAIGASSSNLEAHWKLAEQAEQACSVSTDYLRALEARSTGQAPVFQGN